MNNQLYSDWEDAKDIVIYGYGKVARNMLSYFTNNFNVKYIVDGDIKKDLKVLFQNVDYVFSYRILGGEPLINRDLSEILQFIGENYKNKIGDVGIITNGTILPDNRLLEVSKKYDVKYYISDYTNQVNYKDRLNTVVSKLHDSGIYYEITQSFRWCDFGFPCYNVSLPNGGR